MVAISVYNDRRTNFWGLLPRRLPPVHRCMFVFATFEFLLRRLCLSRFLTLLFLFVCLAAPATAQRGALTQPRNLAQLEEQSATILRGRVVSAFVEPHPQYAHIHTVLVTLHVEESLKGAPGTTYTFRQFIWDARDRFDSAGYRKGQHLLLLMNSATPLGLTSPAGIEQGRFRILRDAAGREVAVNGAANRGLFRDLASQLTKKGIRLSAEMSRVVAQPPAGPLPLDDLRQLIREIREQRGVK